MQSTPNIKYKIALTVGASISPSITFKTGVPQNIAFLFDLLKLLGHEVTLVTEENISVSNISLSKQKSYPIISLSSTYKTNKLDLLLEIGQTLTPTARSKTSSTGCKIISVRCGNSLIIDMEDLFTKSSKQTGFQHVKNGLDHIWILPHHTHQATYLESLLDAKSSVMPYIWEPDFLHDNFNNPSFRDKPNVYIMEPNMSVLKNALIPLVILNNQYLYSPHSFNKAYIVNGQQFANDPYFLNNIVKNLDVLNGNIAKDKVFFTPRCTFQDALTYPDILLSHQWLNGLNYLSLEALYLGVALVHNSEYLKGVGYFYPEFDAALGQKALNEALSNHEHSFSQQRDENRLFLKQYSIFNKSVQDGYTELITNALNN